MALVGPAAMHDHPLVRFYSVSDYEYTMDHEVPDDSTCRLMVYPQVHVRGQFIEARVEPVSFETFVQAFPRKKDIAKPRPVDRRSGMAKAVRDQLLEEFPWLTEADVGVALAGRASRSTTVGDEEADRKRPAKVLDAEEVEDIVLQTSKELAAKRLELSHGDDDTHFYTRVPGGNWTKQFLKTAANGSMVCGRSHTAKFCKLYSWPFQKTNFLAPGTKRVPTTSLACGLEWEIIFFKFGQTRARNMILYSPLPTPNASKRTRNSSTGPAPWTSHLRSSLKSCAFGL